MAGKIAKVLLEVVGDTSGLDKTVADANRKMKGIGGRGGVGGGGAGGVGGAGGFGSAGAAAAGGALGAGAGSPSAFRQKMDARMERNLNAMKDEVGIRRDRGDFISNALGGLGSAMTQRSNRHGAMESRTGDPTGIRPQSRFKSAGRNLNRAANFTEGLRTNMSKSLGQDFSGVGTLVPGLTGPTAAIATGVVATSYLSGFNKNRASNFSDISRFKGADFGLAQGIKQRAQERMPRSQSAMDSFWLGAEEATGGEGSWMERALAEAPITGSKRARGIGAAVATGDGLGTVLLDAFLGTTHLDYLFGSPYAADSANVSLRRAGA